MAKKERGTKVSKQKTVHDEVEFPHEPFLFWRFDFNSAKTGAKSQLPKRVPKVSWFRLTKN